MIDLKDITFIERVWLVHWREGEHIHTLVATSEREYNNFLATLNSWGLERVVFTSELDLVEVPSEGDSNGTGS